MKKSHKYLLFRIHSLDWWISLLFMIGSLHFVVGSLLILIGSAYIYLIDLIYFIGSLFFTLAAYLQYYNFANSKISVGKNTRLFLVWKPKDIDFLSTFPQLIGTIAFNITTATAFLTNLNWLGYDKIVWRPNFFGSILFLISGAFAVYAYCNNFWCFKKKDILWWITIINFIGCVAFMISAILAFARPQPLFNNLSIWSVLFTLIGAICFFIGAYLIWPKILRDGK